MSLIGRWAKERRFTARPVEPRAPARRGAWARRIGALALVGTLLGGASAFGSSAASAVTRATGPATSGPLPARIQARVRQIVRRFPEHEPHPRSPDRHLEPEGNVRHRDRRRRSGDRAPLNTDMQFKIASQTKTFTANLILQLVGEGKLSLDDHISKWIAGVPNGDRITIRQLLNHTSGLADGFTSPAVQGQLVTGCTVTTCSRPRRRRPRSRRPARSGRTATTATTCSGGWWSWSPARI